jgi:hypothetical protein
VLSRDQRVGALLESVTRLWCRDPLRGGAPSHAHPPGSPCSAGAPSGPVARAHRCKQALSRSAGRCSPGPTARTGALEVRWTVRSAPTARICTERRLQDRVLGNSAGLLGVRCAGQVRATTRQLRTRPRIRCPGDPNRPYTDGERAMRPRRTSRGPTSPVAQIVLPDVDEEQFATPEPLTRRGLAPPRR